MDLLADTVIESGFKIRIKSERRTTEGEAGQHRGFLHDHRRAIPNGVVIEDRVRVCLSDEANHKH